MALWQDFKKFAFKGNAIDLAVGVVIGAAFGKIVTAVVSNVVMPLVALVLPTGDWRKAGIVLRRGAEPKQDVILGYGELLAALVDFLVVAFVLFLIVSKVTKAIEQRMAAPLPEKPPETKSCPFCLDTIPVKATRCKSCTSEVEAG